MVSYGFSGNEEVTGHGHAKGVISEGKSEPMM
jgi:hypothetical protein